MSQPPRYSTLYPLLPPSSSNPAVLILNDDPAPSRPPVPAAASTNQGTATTPAPAGSIGTSHNGFYAQRTLLNALLRFHSIPQPILLQPLAQLQLQIIPTQYPASIILHQAPAPIVYTQSPSFMVQPKFIYPQPTCGYLLPLPVGTMQFWQQNPLPQGVCPGDSVLLLPGA